MQHLRFIVIVISVIYLMFYSECQALRCRTDDGPSEEDLKRIVRICMHKVGENDTDDEYSYDDSDSDQSGDEMTTERSYGSSNFNNRNFQSNNMPYSPYGSSNQNTNMRRHNFNSNNYNNNNKNNNNNNWNGQSNQFGGMGIQRNNNNQSPNRNQYPNQYPGNNFNNNRSNSNNNQTEQDRACIVHCFFHELKMTNTEDFPDKRKMIQTLTKDIREQDMKEFYVDSIQECFHMVDNMDNYNRRKNKCDVAQTIVTCLTERAKTNCEDFRNDMVLF